MDKQHTTINKQVKITANENPSIRLIGIRMDGHASLRT